MKQCHFWFIIANAGSDSSRTRGRVSGHGARCCRQRAGHRCWMSVESRVVKVGIVLEVVKQLVVMVQVPATCFGNHTPSLP